MTLSGHVCKGLHYKNQKTNIREQECEMHFQVLGSLNIQSLELKREED